MIEEAYKEKKAKKLRYLWGTGKMQEFIKKKQLNGELKEYYCTSCQYKVPYKIGKAQVENKREFAPICIKCILNK